jgi:hypothetical protein
MSTINKKNTPYTQGKPVYTAEVIKTRGGHRDSNCSPEFLICDWMHVNHQQEEHLFQPISSER